MSERLTLQDLVDLLSNKQNVTKKDAETFLRELVALISETIEQKDFVRIKDFGTFKLTPVNARRSVDVNTGDPIEIPAHYKLSFTPEKVLREGVNKPFSHFESILLVDDEVVFEDKDTTESKPKVKSVPKKAEAKPVETPKPILTPKEEEVPEELELVIKQEEEEVIVADKADKVLKEVPETTVLEKEVVIENDELQREEELADINSFLTKGIEDKKEEKPTIASTDSPVQKETTIPTPRKVIRQYDDDDDDDFTDYEYIAQQKKKRNTWIAVGVLILVLLGCGIWGYNYLDYQPDVMPYAQDNNKITISEEEKPAIQQSAITSDPIITEETKTEVVTPPTVEEQPIVTPPTSVKPEQGAREIEVKAGQTMRVLGMEYFGHGSFWVYIFEENRDKISRPDAVFAGMKLIIPPASKYGIDANDKDAVRKAQRQELKLFGEFSDK